MHGVLVKLAKYNQAMNSAVYSAAEQLPDDLRKKDLGAYFKSIHGTLNHLLWADKNWLRRFVLAGLGYGRLTDSIYTDIQDRISVHAFEIYSDFSRLKQERAVIDTKIITWLTEGLTEKHLDQTLQYRNAKGEDMQRPVVEVLVHLFNHQTHHRGQITTLLTQQGIDVGVTDFIHFAGKF
jgi:uncharacterized damage-inducible protein DinB